MLFSAFAVLTGAAAADELARHRQLAASGQLNLGDRQLFEIYCQHTLQVSAQISEFLGPGCSMLGGSGMIAAEMEAHCQINGDKRERYDA